MAFLAPAIAIRPAHNRRASPTRTALPARTNPTLSLSPPPARTMPHPVLADPAQNRGRRFSYAERERNNLVGLVHPAPPRTLHQEVARLLNALRSLPTALTRYQFLMRILQDDQALFFAAAQANLPKILPIIYTPTVGDACLSYSELPLPLRGLWIDAQQRGRIHSVLSNWPEDNIDVVVVSDCQRILGLGDLGANGMGIPVGKLLLYSACGGINPDRCLPVVLDVGCNNPAIRNNENYIGLPQDRLTGQAYDDFVQEFMDAIVQRYGKTCLIQFEDFGNGNALRLLEHYREKNCCFNDDVQGTAAVGLAGILSALRIERVPSTLSEHKFLFLGAGSAGIGIARLIVLALMREGVSEEEAAKKCFFVDSRGLVYQGRERVTPAKATFAHEIGDDVKAVAADGLEAIVKALRPTALIGVSTIPGSFTEGVIKQMGEINERPLVFALSNPTSKAECTADAAYKHTDGRAIFASGSPFAPVKLDERRTLVPGQGNNSYIFPGLGLGIVTAGARHVPESMLLAASDSLSKLVDKEQLAVSCVYPDLNSLMDISAHIAMAVCEEAKRLGLNEKNVDDITVEKIRAQMYEPGRGLM